MGLQQKSKPNRDKLGIKELSISVAGMTPEQAEHKINVAKNLPQVYYYGIELVPQNIIKLTVDSTKFLPMVYVCFSDVYNVMHDIGFPADNAKLTVVIPSNHEGLGSVFMDFKIQKFSVELMRGSTAKKIHMWGVCNVEGMLVTKYKAFENTTSYELMKSMASDIGLGFMSNVDTSSDAMTWLNPGRKVIDFIEDTVNKAWVGENGYVWAFVDLFYNMNYVDVEKSLSQSIDDIKWVHSSVLNNKLINQGQQSDKIIKPFLTNERSQKGTTSFFTGEKILNQSTDISLKRGYLRNVHFYDVDGNWGDKAGAYRIYGLDTITSADGANNAILLKGDPGSTEFYNNNKVNHYMDKIDTKNVYPDYLWASLQNDENLHDLQKIGMQVLLPTPNFNIRRFEKLKLMFTNSSVGIKANQRNLKLNGEWLVTGQRFEWNGSALWQILTIVKRELTVDEI